MSLRSLFRDRDKHQSEIDELSRRLGEMERIVDNAASQLFGGGPESAGLFFRAGELRAGKNLTINKDGIFLVGVGPLSEFVNFAYAGIAAIDNTTETVISSSGVAVQVTIFNQNNPYDRNGGAIPDHTNDHTTIVRPGDYYISVSATVNSVAGAASRFEMTVQKNNGAQAVEALHVDRDIAGGSGSSGSVSMSGFATLAAGDTIEAWIENETNTQNYVVEDITLNVLQVSAGVVTPRVTDAITVGESVTVTIT